MRALRIGHYGHRWPWVGGDGGYVAIPFPIATETTRDWRQYFSTVVIRLPKRRKANSERR